MSGYVFVIIFYLLRPGVSFALEQGSLQSHKTSIRTLTGNEHLRSIKGFDFHVYQFDQPNAQRRVLIQGGLHGNEFLASEFVLWLAERFANKLSPLNLAHRYSFDFIPYVNPDGTFLGSRQNSRRVNLNRNFDVFWGVTKEYPGSYAFSEIESQAVKQLFEKRSYAVAIDIHGFVNWFVGPSEPSAFTEKPQSDMVQKHQIWTKLLKQHLPDGYEYRTAIGLGDGGAFEDWAFWRMKAYAFCFELSSRQRFVEVAFADTKQFFLETLLGGFSRAKKASRSSLLSSAPAKVDLFLDYERSIANILRDIPEDDDPVQVVSR